MSERRGFLQRLFVVALWVLGFFAVFGAAGLIVIIIRDTNTPPPNPYKAMDEMLAEYTTAPGRTMVFVARNNNIIYTHGQPEGVDANTPFRVDGISDTFTAMGIGVLVDRGELRFDQTIGSILPDLPSKVGNLTLMQLIDHTSGLRMTQPHQDGANWLENEPGATSRYAALNYGLLERALEASLDEPLPGFMQSAVFEPAEMPHASVAKEETGYAWYASAEDLFAWDKVLSTNKLARFRTVMFKLSKAKRLASGELGAFAGGWFIGDYRGLRLEVATSFHNETNAVMARFPERRFVCLILSESPRDTLNAREMVRPIGETYLGREMPRPSSERDQDGTGI